MSEELFYGLLIILWILGIVFTLSTIIGGAVYLSKDTKKQGQENANWVVIYLLVGILTQLHFVVMGVYFFMTNRKGKGFLWILGFPAIFVAIFLIGVAAAASVGV